MSGFSLIVYLAMVESQESHSINLVLNLCQLVLFVSRAIVQITFPQDHEQLDYSDLEEGLLNSNRAQTMDTNINPTLESDSTTKRTRSMFNERLNRNSEGVAVTIKSAKKVGGAYQYQLNVSWRNKVHKVYKSYVDFCELDDFLRDHVDSAGRYAELSTFGTLLDSEVSTAIRKLQSYVDNVLNSFQPLPHAVMGFLKLSEIPASPGLPKDLAISKKKVAEKKNVRSDASNGSRTPDLKASYGDDTSPQDRKYSDPKPIANRNDMRKMTIRPDKDFCPYIAVQLIEAKMCSGSSHYEYRFELSISEHSEGSWYISKRYREFKQLYETLVEKKLKPPKLPPSRIMNSPQIVQERKVGLTHFLEVLLNEEVYLKCEEVAAFVSLDGEIQRLFLANSEKYDFSDWRAQIAQYRVRLLDDKTPVTEFIINIFRNGHMEDENSEPDTGASRVKNHYRLYKRFTEFENLHDALEIRFGKDGLPQLPAKFNAFFAQTTVESRMKGLEKFLNLLFRFPEVEDCFAFRKFLNAPISELKKHNKQKISRSRGSLKEEEAKEEEDRISKEYEEGEIPSSLGSQTDKLETIQQLRHKLNESKEHA